MPHLPGHAVGHSAYAMEDEWDGTGGGAYKTELGSRGWVYGVCYAGVVVVFDEQRCRAGQVDIEVGRRLTWAGTEEACWGEPKEQRLA